MIASYQAAEQIAEKIGTDFSVLDSAAVVAGCEIAFESRRNFPAGTFASLVGFVNAADKGISGDSGIAAVAVQEHPAVAVPEHPAVAVQEHLAVALLEIDQLDLEQEEVSLGCSVGIACSEMLFIEREIK